MTKNDHWDLGFGHWELGIGHSLGFGYLVIGHLP